MELKSQTVGNISVVYLSGRFDSYEALRVVSWFEQATSNIVINLAEVTFIDSSALALLIKAMKHCRQVGGNLTLCGLQKQVRVVFELTRLDKAFNIYTTQDEAIKELQRS